MKMLFSVAASLFAATFGSAAHGRDVPQGQLDDRAQPTRRMLELRIDPRAQRFSGRARIDVELSRATDLIWLHGMDLNVSTVSFTAADGESIPATYEPAPGTGVAAVHLARVCTGPAVMTFTYDAALKPGLVGLYVAQEQGLHYVASQMQDAHFRRVAPSFDEPRFKVPTTIVVEAPEGNTVVSNAPRLSGTPLGDGWIRHRFAETRPLPTELLAIVVGPYDVLEWTDIPASDIRDRPIRLRAITPRGKDGKAGYALASTAALLETLERYFDMPYPYEKLDLVAPVNFIASGMENAGAIFYSQDLLFTSEHTPPAQRDFFTMVHAHELAHMWFGDLVTPRWWTDLWLSESFASWMGDKVAATRSAGLQRRTAVGSFGVMKEDSLASARAIRTPIRHTREAAGAFSGVTYSKGAAVLTMFEQFVGEDSFRDGVRRYIAHFADGVADFDDFARAIAETAGDEALVEAMAGFVNQPGMPLVEAKLDCTGEKPAVELRQLAYRPLGSRTALDRHWTVPICLSYRERGVRGRVCTMLNDAGARLELDASSCPQWLMPNADGSGYYRFSVDSAGWRALRDGFAELSATEALAVVDSLEATFNSGRLDSADYLGGLRVAARSEYADVAMAALQASTRLFALVDETDVRDLRQWIAHAFPVRPTGGAGTSDEALLRQEWSSTRVMQLRDTRHMAELASQARVALEQGGDPVVAGLNEQSFQQAVTAALMLEGEKFYDALLSTAARGSKSGGLQDAMAMGVGAIWDRELAARVRHDILTTERFSGWQVRWIIDAFLHSAALRDESWAWLKEHFDALLEKHLSAGHRSQLGGLVDSWCDLDRAMEIRAFLQAHQRQLPRHERFSDFAWESVELCVALREARGAELAFALAGRGVRHDSGGGYSVRKPVQRATRQ
jgi:alanyl aminopeptidase